MRQLIRRGAHHGRLALVGGSVVVGALGLAFAGPTLADEPDRGPTPGWAGALGSGVEAVYASGVELGRGLGAPVSEADLLEAQTVPGVTDGGDAIPVRSRRPVDLPLPSLEEIGAAAIAASLAESAAEAPAPAVSPAAAAAAPSASAGTSTASDGPSVAVTAEVVTPPTTGYDPWLPVRLCESNNNYAINTGNGYYGAYQFSASTWNGVAALVAPEWVGVLPSAAPPAVQDRIASALAFEVAGGGLHHWPICGARYGG
ncbi:MAG: transglycosylase family protein [Acidimicrobiales bacterium]|nr:transglycosylase family protein [Acidimicrobiales bacterium]